MEKMSVLLPFEEYDGDDRVLHVKGDEITVTNERADQLRALGYARKKATRGSDDHDEPEEVVEEPEVPVVEYEGDHDD